MKRRAFTLGMGAIVLGAGPLQAESGDTLHQGAIRALRLRFGVDDFQTFDRVEVGDGQQALGHHWTTGAPVFREDRVNLSGAGGGIGGLFRTPFRTRWAGAQALGSVERVGSGLVMRIGGADRFQGYGVTVGAGDYSWDLREGLALVSPTSGRGATVGTVRVEEGGRLLLLINARPAF